MEKHCFPAANPWPPWGGEIKMPFPPGKSGLRNPFSRWSPPLYHLQHAPSRSDELDVLSDGHHSPIQDGRLLFRLLWWRFDYRSDQSGYRGLEPQPYLQPVTCLLHQLLTDRVSPPKKLIHTIWIDRIFAVVIISLRKAVTATDPNYPTKHLSKANQVFSHEQLRLIKGRHVWWRCPLDIPWRRAVVLPGSS